MPHLPWYMAMGFGAGQDSILEVWIEKSTQNDWLVPLCRRRGVNLVVGIGEQSHTRARDLALRAAKSKVPVRVLYLSDFDPSGRSMPKAVARKVEFTIAKFDLDVDFQLIPLVLSQEQCTQYQLPRTPIKETDRRRQKFERRFGLGATELDALEALHPGEMARLLETEFDKFLDKSLQVRVERVQRDIQLSLDRAEKVIQKRYAEEIEALKNKFASIISNLNEWEESADKLWETITDDMERNRPDLSSIELPRSNAPGKTDRFVLFESKRDYLTQMDYYNRWREGAEENGASEEDDE